jgi:HEAT repeat protein
LQNPDESIRLRAAKELGKLGAAAREAIPALKNALKDADEDVRRVAGTSLKSIEAYAPIV